MSGGLHTVGLAAHVDNFHAALLITKESWASDAVALLDADPIAQIMSFIPSRRRQCGLSAVCPQMRLDSEVKADESDITRWETGVRVVEDASGVSSEVASPEFLFSISVDGKTWKRQQIALSLWWASRCGLPVELVIDNDDSAMLACLDDTLRSRVKTLSVNMKSHPAMATDAAALFSTTLQATVLTSLLSFSKLHTFSIKSREHHTTNPLSVEVRSALVAAASLPVAALTLDGWGGLVDLSPVAGGEFLRSLTVSNCGLRSLKGLSSHPTLETLAIVKCPQLTSVSTLPNVSSLQAVRISGCSLRSLDGLERCTTLRSVDISSNSDVRSLSPLAGAPLLETIVASYCGIRSVQGLGSCPALTQITLSDNINLQSLGDLSKAPSLQTVLAKRCDLRNLGAAGPWSALRKIDVRGNQNLRSLAGLAGAPLLEEVRAEDCDIQDFTLLETRPNLRNREQDYDSDSDDEMVEWIVSRF